MVYMKKERAGEPSARAQASLCVRISCPGFVWRVNKSRFLCPARKQLHKYLAKCYEKRLRGESPSSVANKIKNAEVRDMVMKLDDNFIKPLPDGFHRFPVEEKRKELKRILDEREDAAAEELGLDLEYMNNGVAGAARNRLDHPEGRPPTGLHPTKLDQLEKFLLEPDANELSEALDDDASTLDRTRLKEIHAQLEGYITSDDLSPFSMAEMEGCILGASNFDDDVEGHTLTCEQKLMPPKRAISEALQVLPLRTGVSRTKLADIHPLHNNMIGYIQNESLVSIPNQKQLWATEQRYGVHTPFTEESSWSTYYTSPDRMDPIPKSASTADCYGTNSFTSTADCYGPHSYASTADCYGPRTFTSTG